MAKISLSLILFLMLCNFCLQGRAQVEKTLSAEDLHRIAIMHISNGQCKAAADVFDQIHELPLRADLKAFYLSLSGLLYQDSLKNVPKAQEYFTRSVGFYPQIIQLTQAPINIGVTYASTNLAQAAEQKKDWPVAIDNYNQAITLLNHMQMEGILASGMKPYDLQMCINSFKQSRAIDYYRNNQLEDAELAFNELKYSYAQMQHSTDSEEVVQGWQLDLMLQQAEINMYAQNPADKTKAYKAAYNLVEKLNHGLYDGDQNVSETLQMQAPLYLAMASDVYVKAGKAKEALGLTEQAMAMATCEYFMPQVLNARGEAFLADGQVGQAKGCWAKVMIFDPTFYSGNRKDLILNKKFAN